MEREEFINHVLNSVNEIKKITPNEAVLKRIEFRINESKISKKSLWLVAASIVVLISLNIVILKDNFSNDKTAIISFEQVINQNNQLYK